MASSSSTAIRNHTEGMIEVMEGIEGVYRHLDSIPPLHLFVVRNVIKYCTYAVCERATGWWKVIPSNWHLNCQALKVVCEYYDNRLYLRYDGPGVVEDSVPFSILLHPRSHPDESDPGLGMQMIHLHQIGCLHWINTGQAGTVPSETLLFEAGRAKTALELWESKEKVFKLQIDSFEAELKDCSNQIFQWLIAFYTVVHGVLFTVVSQPDSPFTCGKIHISYVLSAIISWITIVGVVHKLKPTEYLDEIIYEHKIRLLAVCSWQSNLKSTGPEFDPKTVVLEHKPRPVRWVPKVLKLPFKEVKYTFVILMCSSVLCYIMQLLKCN